MLAELYFMQNQMCLGGLPRMHKNSGTFDRFVDYKILWTSIACYKVQTYFTIYYLDLHIILNYVYNKIIK